MAEAAAARSGGGKQFVRAVGPREHYIGIGILSAVMLLCTWFVVRGVAPKGLLWGAYDPSLFGQSVTAATPAAVPAAAAVPVAETKAAPAAQGGFLPVAAPKGFTAGQVERFRPDNLFEKVDGKDNSYADFGFAGLECQTFTSTTDKECTVDVFIFDMAKPLQAFGMLSSERNGNDPVPQGQDGYRAAGSVFFRSGRYYVNVVAATEGEAQAAAAKALAEAVAAKLPKETYEPPGKAWFPKDGLVADSVGYRLKNALGQDWLSDLWLAKYKAGEKEVETYLALRESADKAADDLKRYQAVMEKAGKVTPGKSAGAATLVLDESKGAGKGPFSIAFAKGKVFGGVNFVETSQADVEQVIVKLVTAAGKMR